MAKTSAIAGRGVGAPVSIFNHVLRNPAMRDPRGFILPSDQPDFLTATKLVNILINAGVDVHRATSAFTVAGKQYPAGSYVIKSAQAFRAHLLDMFEPQNHPDDIPYPGAAPRAPYDVTGYNIAYSMGIRFDRILDSFDGPFEKVPDVIKPPAGRVPAAAKSGFTLSHATNDSFSVVNRLLKSNEAVYWRPDGIFIPWSAPAAAIVSKAAEEKGLNFEAPAFAGGSGALRQAQGVPSMVEGRRAPGEEYR